MFELAYILSWWLCKLGHGHFVAVKSWQRVNDLLASYNAATLVPLMAQENHALPSEQVQEALDLVAAGHRIGKVVLTIP